ncbi:hypothetical protein HSBAA_54000 [Vreelandella sulfidaeris]|uniref:Transporter n=1 Tax=Vreelandella sulfidaeris TaxID=115553 RepID=A0A455UME2_9GAMM|nr:hypothetical protein HSBAA_54000 [Halomonas sulfidaeris]
MLRGGGLNLNVVNFLFLFLAIVLHRTPRNLLYSLNEAIKGGAGIVIQFPFYAGIMAIMVQSGLAESMSEWLVSFATATSLPLLVVYQRRDCESFRPFRRGPVGRSGAGNVTCRSGARG